jgi:FixJ family two-component response regulator
MLVSRRVYVVDDDTEAQTSLTFSAQRWLYCSTIEAVAFSLDETSLRTSTYIARHAHAWARWHRGCEGGSAIWSGNSMIMMTGRPAVCATAVRTDELGAVDFLEKPRSQRGLALETLEKCLQDTRRALIRAANLPPRPGSWLTPREFDGTDGGAHKGLSNKGDCLSGSGIRTVEMYRGTMMDRLEVKSLPEALRPGPFTVGMLDGDHSDAGRTRQLSTAGSGTPRLRPISLHRWRENSIIGCIQRLGLERSRG